MSRSTNYRILRFIPRTEYGPAAQIMIPSQTSMAGDTVAFVTSLDEFNNCICPNAGLHWWAQAGHVIGLAPNGVTYTQPEMYIEANGNSYTFQPIASASWSTYHTFQVWISPTTGAANFAIDESQVATVSMPLDFNQGGQVTNFLEVHQSSDCCDVSTGFWNALQYYECGFIGQPCWQSWDCGLNCKVVAVSTPPYYVQSNSKTSFNVYTDPNGSRGGVCYGNRAGGIGCPTALVS